jgi:hypothetical protein
VQSGPAIAICCLEVVLAGFFQAMASIKGVCVEIHGEKTSTPVLTQAFSA